MLIVERFDKKTTSKKPSKRHRGLGNFTKTKPNIVTYKRFSSEILKLKAFLNFGVRPYEILLNILKLKKNKTHLRKKANFDPQP